jgi:hypothetical protein
MYQCDNTTVRTAALPEMPVAMRTPHVRDEATIVMRVRSRA